MRQSDTIMQRPDLCTVESHGNCTVYAFHSVEAAVAASEAVHAKRLLPLSQANDCYSECRVASTDRRSGTLSWCEGMTNEQAIAAITNPPQSRRELIGKFDSGEFGAAFRPQPRRRLVKRLDDGDAIDAERYASEFTVEGVWSKRIRSSRPRPAVRVMVNGAASCNTDNLWFARAAAAVLAAVRSAEDCGYAVEVWWSNVQEIKGSTAAITVCLKRIEDSFDWTTMVGVCVGATFFRTIGFDLIDICAVHGHGGGYGYPSKWSNDWGTFDIVSPAYFREDSDAEAWLAEAVKALDKQVAEQGEAVAA